MVTITHGHHDTLIQKHFTESEDEQFNVRYWFTEQQNKELTYTEQSNVHRKVLNKKLAHHGFCGSSIPGIYLPP
jgi:hypothetical protein